MHESCGIGGRDGQETITRECCDAQRSAWIGTESDRSSRSANPDFHSKRLHGVSRKTRLQWISVQDIAKHAMINRATFYRYYKDKYFLAEEILKGALRKMEVEIGPRIFRHQSDMTRGLAEKRAHAAWASLFEHFASNSRIYAQLLSGKGSAWFMDRMRQDMITSFRRIHRTHPNIVPIEVARCFFASATIGVTYFWLKTRHEVFRVSNGDVVSPHPI